ACGSGRAAGPAGLRRSPERPPAHRAGCRGPWGAGTAAPRTGALQPHGQPLGAALAHPAPVRECCPRQGPEPLRSRAAGPSGAAASALVRPCLVDIGLLGHAGLAPFGLGLAVDFLVPQQGAALALTLLD